jgi:hypothetical protein
MNRGVPCLVFSLFAVVNLVFGHCHAQEQRKIPSVESNAGQSGAPNVVRLAFLGDLMLGGEISETLRSQPPEWFWGDTLPILRQADAVIANLEGPITASDERWTKSSKMYHFKADPEAVRILTAGNIRFREPGQQPHMGLRRPRPVRHLGRARPGWHRPYGSRARQR